MVKRIGVLALQGGFIEHVSFLEKLGAEAVPVRKPDELERLGGLVIPGGESTTIMNLLHGLNLFGPVRELAQTGLPVMGTCAGMILMAKKVSGSSADTLAPAAIIGFVRPRCNRPCGPLAPVTLRGCEKSLSSHPVWNVLGGL